MLQYLICSQLWLNLAINDHHSTNIDFFLEPLRNIEFELIIQMSISNGFHDNAQLTFLVTLHLKEIVFQIFNLSHLMFSALKKLCL
jgi:hypothetical protein